MLVGEVMVTRDGRLRIDIFASVPQGPGRPTGRSERIVHTAGKYVRLRNGNNASAARQAKGMLEGVGISVRRCVGTDGEPA